MERSRIAVKISERLYIKIMQLDFLYFGEHTYGHSQKPFISAHSTQRSVILLAWKKEAPPVVQPEAAARRPSKTRSKKQKPQVDEAPRIYSEKVTIESSRVPLACDTIIHPTSQFHSIYKARSFI